MITESSVLDAIESRLSASVVARQATRDAVSTCWVSPESMHDVLRFLKYEIDRPDRFLYDLTAID